MPQFKVNITETQKRFLSELVYLFFYDIIKRFPESIQIQLIANYFTMMYRRKALLCVFQLRNFGKRKLSNLDYIAYTVNEKYLLHEVDLATQSGDALSEIMRKSSGVGVASKMNVNGDYFIRVNQLQAEFGETVEVLGSRVMMFWRYFLHNELDVRASINTGT